jgi:DNA-binding transcriptional LysR family regulator
MRLGSTILIVGMLHDARIVPNVSQTAEEISTPISLVDAHMGIAILPLSAVKHSVASVIACEIADQILMSEIGIAVSKGSRAAVIDAFRSFALKKVRSSREGLRHQSQACQEMSQVIEIELVALPGIEPGFED